MFEEFKIFIQPFKEKLDNLLNIGSYTKVTGSEGQLQKIQLKTLRNIEDALKVGQFGFNSKAPIGSRCIVAKIGNDKIVIANEHLASIIDIATGDSIQYNENGDFVKVEKDKITLQAKEVITNCEKYTVNATTEINLNTPTINNNGKNIDSTHGHAQGNDSNNDNQVSTGAVL